MTRLLDSLWTLLERELFPLPSTDTLFNPYNGHDSTLDLPEGQIIRRDNLRSYLSGFSERPSIMLVGEAPGPWGCRFSGVSFTSEAQLCQGELPFGGRQSSLAATPHRERSGDVVWQLLRPHYPRFLLWNCVPFHPHHEGKPLSIRTPKTREVESGLELLRAVHEEVSPEKVIAIGRKAEQAFQRLGIPAAYARHPSQGGVREFRAGIQVLLASTDTR
ncbi:MAG: uracil-DNA glycosylase [Chloroflexota bacterium]